MMEVKPLVVCPILVIVLALSSPVFAQSLIKVSGDAAIIDGDTLEVQGQQVRLHGIDAAETGQRCAASGRKIVRPSDWAVKRLAKLTSGGVTCLGTSYDDYGRLIAVCVNKNAIEINETLVSDGLAWAFVKFSADYIKAEKAAKSQRKGIWGAVKCQTPWAFREARWNVQRPSAPAPQTLKSGQCVIKGNISEKGQIYHMPWQRYYSKTKIDTSRGERWFCDENEAIAAGWRKSKT